MTSNNSLNAVPPLGPVLGSCLSYFPLRGSRHYATQVPKYQLSYSFSLLSAI
jgi:hypothetical protein